ncbi:Riboflavin biosynthesis bifunctional RIBD: diaminohydroxyphosphoribosylaminopyrimid ine deaminase + 5-amino-6-(5-phosphoribosylamino)uracil reductase oxidoreductase protein [gamma proteobacterium HdN1]|nr:Riboflavin biosynthesis bifunctional RIBD: diaminohydroxyphosphoribosylaminopyrimid ine deaminase + 5-amino-6-(5-phosphoribosylamino)uracil reductase oxidoreductase protein [gamma proteobacterium HdN1]
MPSYDFNAFDHQMMSRALQLAPRGLYTTHPNPRVGCVIVQNGAIVGEGWHQLAGQGHAEVLALEQAGERAKGATAYVTLEPCAHYGRTPPCANALIKAGIARVVGAMSDPNPRVSGGGYGLLRAAGIKTDNGLLKQQAEALNPGFIKRMRGGLPWVRVKSGISQDARTAMACGESQWITSSPARADVQRLRARSEAVITGVDTVLSDDPALTVRPASWPADDAPWGWPDGFTPIQPLRVILDSQLRTPTSARLLREPGQNVFAHIGSNPEREEALRACGATCISFPGRDGRVDLVPVLQWLAAQEVNEVLIEAGASVAGSFIEAGLVDEWVVYQAPCLLGSEARPALILEGLSGMKDKRTLDLVDSRQIGLDHRFTYRLRSLPTLAKSL